jgi:hypothetical protein
MDRGKTFVKTNGKRNTKGYTGISMNKFVCVLKTGGDYTKKNVFLLKRQVDKYLPAVDKFICYSNIEIKGINTVPLVGDYKGKWSMHEVFREKGKVLVTGLDTLFVKNCDWLFDLADEINRDTFYGMKTFNKRGGKTPWGNNPMLWNGDWSHLFWDYLDQQTPYHLKLEQSWAYRKLQACGANIKYLDNEGLGLFSYKHHCRHRGVPDNADIIIFHGKPRPHECTEEWVIERYYG